MVRLWRGTRTILSAVLVVGILTLPRPGTGQARQPILDGNWIGHFALPAHAAQVRLDIQIYGSTALVALGPGHASLQPTRVKRSATMLSFALPGVPLPLRFALSPRGSGLVGTVTQGALS